MADGSGVAVRQDTATGTRWAAEIAQSSLEARPYLLKRAVADHPDRVRRGALVGLLDEPEIVVRETPADRYLRGEDEGVDLLVEAVAREDAREADGVGVRADLPGERDTAVAEHRDHLLRALLDHIRSPARVRDTVTPRQRVGADLVADVATIDPLEALALGLVVHRDPLGLVSVHGASR